MNDSTLPAPDGAAHDSAWGRGVVRFFALTFAITWLLQLPAVFGQAGLLPGGAQPYMIGALLGIFGPLVAGYVVCRSEDGKEGGRRLLKSALSPRPGLLWWALALFLPGTLLTLGLFAHRLAGGDLPLTYIPEAPRWIAALLISVGEELGWRGFALPRMSERLGRVRASVLLGVLWALWHIPMFLGAGVPLAIWPMMLVLFVAGSLVFTWFHFRTGGSVFIAVLLHIGTHLNNSHLALPAEPTPAVLHTGGWALLACLLFAFDRKTFSPERD